MCELTRRLSLLAGAFVVASASSAAQGQQRVVVGSKGDTEGALLGNMIVQLLADAGIPVDSALLRLGPTDVLRSSLLAGEIDIYPEYTGNGATFFDQPHDPVWKQPQAAYDRVRRLDAERNRLIWLDRAPANNTWLIAVRRDVALERNLKTMEDFAALVRREPTYLKLAASVEFVESPAALGAFERTYDFRLPRQQVLALPGGDTSRTSRAASNSISGANAAMVYGTDGALAALDLVVMEDNKGAQIVYEPAPVVRAVILNRYPEIRPLLSKAFSTLTLSRLQELNASIAVNGRDARDVARSYLEQQGMLR